MTAATGTEELLAVEVVDLAVTPVRELNQRLHDLNGEPLPEDAATRPLDDPWEGIVDTTAARSLLGYRPIYPTVYTAKAAGAL